jgi:hypothetical protein
MILVLISVRGSVIPQSLLRLKGSGKLKNSLTSSSLEPATFRLVAECLNELRYRVPSILLLLLLLWPSHSCRLHTTVNSAAFQRSHGICGGQSDSAAGFLCVLRFPLPNIPPTAPHSASYGAGTVGQTVTDVPSGLSLCNHCYYY